MLSPTHLRLEVWERGSGHTQACGTGACATVVAAVVCGKMLHDNWCKVSLPGGDLEIKWSSQDKHVHMRGPAVKIFTGEAPVVESLFS